MSLAALSSLLLLATAASDPSRVLRVSVILGEDTRICDTSDQERWAVMQAKTDVTAALAAAGNRYTLALETVYTGEDSGSPMALEIVNKFLHKSSVDGAGYVVGAYLGESALLAVRPLLPSLGLTLLATASGLPSLPEPRDQILRFWPNDRFQSRVLSESLLPKHAKVVILSRSDLTGRALTGLLASALRHSVLPGGGPFFYNHTVPRSYVPLLHKIRAAIDAATVPISFVCNCASDEISEILDAMRASQWPHNRTRFFLTDRATPTRSVTADPDRMAFAAAMHTTGVLSHLPTTNNPTYASLRTRWHRAGHQTSLFASALSAYDGVRIGTLASVLLGGGRTANATGLREAAMAIANQAWGASGMMALDEAGDLYRARYDVYVVDEQRGWHVSGAPIDARSLPSTAPPPSGSEWPMARPPSEKAPPAEPEPEAWSLDGKPLYPPSFAGIALDALNAQLSIARDALQTPPRADPAKHVWLGRRLAYKWLYREALTAYSDALVAWPHNAFLRRHRGHRYITTRNFSKAEADLAYAAQLVDGPPPEADGWEPDGAPNQYNLPLSSHHFNIRYHLGLSRYLQFNYSGAIGAYERMPRVGPFANDESLAATAHWHYMALRRSGHGASSKAVLDTLAPIHDGMRALDGGSYLQLCLLYKGLRPPPDLSNASALDVATLGYGLGNWHYYNGRKDAAIAVWRRVVNTTYWAAFGFIAAEAELFQLGVLPPEPERRGGRWRPDEPPPPGQPGGDLR